MGPGVDVNATDVAADEAPEQRPVPHLTAQLRVQIAGMHDSEAVVVSLRPRALEVERVEAVRDRVDRRVSKLGKRLADTRCGFWRVHDDRARRRERRAHSRELAAPVQGARVDHHLVERPRIEQVGDPRLSGDARQPGSWLRAVVWLHLDVDQVGRLRQVASAVFTPFHHHCVHASGRRSQRFSDARAPVAGNGSGPGTRCTSVSCGISSPSVSSAGVHLLRAVPGPARQTGS